MASCFLRPIWLGMDSEPGKSHSLPFCGRKFQYLYDKGVKPQAVLFAPDPTGPASVQTTEQFMLSEPFGDYSECKKAKIGDRISLSFTSTTPIVVLKKSQFKAIPEVMNEYGFPFSDGVGVMGENIMRQIMHVKGYRRAAGAVQVRIGGVKGMLTMSTDVNDLY